MAKYVKTEQGYIDASIFAPVPFKPEGKSYLTFSSPKSFTLNLYGKAKHWNGALEYFSADKVWTTWDGTTTLSSVDNDGEHVLYLRGTGNTVITPPSDDDNWILTGYDIQCIGNIENLLDYATVEAGSHPAMGIGCYSAMFRNCKSLTKAPELPATTLADYCYAYMFYGCSSLIQPPALPATTLADYCYQCMFSGCSSLIQPPALPATTLANDCYQCMFDRCSSLIQPPALPATTLANRCYQCMFQNCKSLTKAPALPATTLADYCYAYMFSGCSSLIQPPALPATTLANDCYQCMFDRCSSLIQPPALPATTLADSCYQYMFQNCKSLTKAPALPATRLANYCYYSMFSGCSSITQVPALPVTMLANYCYYSMFQGCTSLKLSSTKTGEYTVAYRIPTTGAGSAAANDVQNMFTSTGGTFTGTPAINTTYYLSTDNMIVRDTEVATLNGYVGSMIDNSASNSLNITGATVGQIAKITAVDGSGKPTSWEAVDIPSGSGGERWRLVRTITLEKNVTAIDISEDNDGNPFALKKIHIYGNTLGTASGGQLRINVANKPDDSHSILGPYNNFRGLDATYKRYWVAESECVGIIGGKGKWSEWYNTPDTASVGAAYVRSGFRTPRLDSGQFIQDRVEFLHIFSNTSGVEFAAGSYIELWGVDA